MTEDAEMGIRWEPRSRRQARAAARAARRQDLSLCLALAALAAVVFAFWWTEARWNTSVTSLLSAPEFRNASPATPIEHHVRLAALCGTFCEG
jgi:hypothetical protein